MHAPPDPGFMSVQAAARFAGVSVGSIRSYIRQGRLQAFKPFGRILVDRVALEQLVRSAVRQPGVAPRLAQASKLVTV